MKKKNSLDQHIFNRFSKTHSITLGIVIVLILSGHFYIQQQLNSVLENKLFITQEVSFSEQTEVLFLEYKKETVQKIEHLKKIEYLLNILVISILILELFLLFRPITSKIKRYTSTVLSSQKKAEEIASKEQDLRILQEQNIHELVSLTKAIDQTLLYARVNEFGVIKSLGEQFAKLLSIENKPERKNITDLLHLGEIQKTRLLDLINQNKGGVYHEEFKVNIIENQNTWLDISILPVFKESGDTERLLLCTDISKRKEAQNEVERLNAEQYKRKEELQKSNASLIVEAQEEERKRIAKEIHDSIGQMLTALKFNIESINLNNIDKATQKIEGLKKLSKDLIQGVRMATFNLTPPELQDYGISIALQKLAKELSKLTGKNILFENISGFEQRFESLVETNLYRVTQEAVNNAVKYAKSEYIMVSVNHSDDLLSITINDNGKGFDITSIPSTPLNKAEGGMGLFFMKERMNYINGRIFINSTPGEGTRVTLNYKIS
ncbi:sensor histidine kinase [Aquimarina sp. 2201CG5-10]|uniref:PAS domain-containing sensor histidine kinase n=1 Tax=Aquimarina callyspongiae TaxID=3098150 RepID=UPI002AB4174C|nr:sensor histidine kinase [Aquimarina sp. 2201CG5-10]MDY8138177.1 sensor histidine kinase [Aquimarina sp. 2201CG5-10]